MVFPEPSIPSTTNSLPGYSCGCIRLFNIGVCAHLDAQRLADDALERSGVALRRPQFEFGVAGRPHLQQRIAAAVVELEAGDRLRVAAIEIFGEPQDRGERPDHLAPLALQRAEFVAAGAAAAPGGDSWR